jgi:hypothetical protein
MRIAALLALLTLVGCQNDYSYRSVVDTRPDIHDVVECRFDETDEGWEQYGGRSGRRLGARRHRRLRHRAALGLRRALLSALLYGQ